MSDIQRLITFLSEACAVAALIFACAKLLVWAVEGILRTFKAYRWFCEYICHRKRFREWLKTNCKELAAQGEK